MKTFKKREIAYVVPTWTLVDGIVFLIIICIWMVALCFFLEKWGNFRIPQPREIFRKFRPMNVDRVRVINNTGSSVIYKTYGKRMSITMADRRKRIESFRENVEKEDREEKENKKLGSLDADSPDSSQPMTWRQRASSLFGNQKKAFQQFRRNSTLLNNNGSTQGDRPRPLVTFNDADALKDMDNDIQEENIDELDDYQENNEMSDCDSDSEKQQCHMVTETAIDDCSNDGSNSQMCSLLTCHSHENEREMRKTSCPSVIITVSQEDSS